MELFKYAVQSRYLEYIDDRHRFFTRKFRIDRAIFFKLANFGTEFLFLINESLCLDFVHQTRKLSTFENKQKERIP